MDHSNVVNKLSFYIIGNNISHSLSPTIHNTAFAEYGLPHHYSIFQTPLVDESVHALITRPDFGGASVTFPHKLSVGGLLDEVSEAARLIGAVNTILVDNGKLKGDNTDWIGILNVLKASKPLGKTSVVIGTGGAARAAVYALKQFGVNNVSIVNRTRSTAEKLAESFPSMNISIHSRLIDAGAANIIIGCIPADDVKEEDIPERLFADTGIVVEMSYRPPVSALMKVAKTRKAWMIVDGVDVLKEQAYAQFEMWTGHRAPVDVIERALVSKR